MPGLLEGMKVLDLSSWRPMPHGTQILADLGAEVLKVEPPGGDPMRSYPEIFASVARGKRSIALDLASESGRRRAMELALRADVVCESWRPGVADRLGLGYRSISASHPSVIYCSLSGYGQDGPLRSLPGHDLNFQALGGAVAPPHETDPDPAVPRLPVADLEGGTLCALLICASWARRNLTGAGQRIDVAMADVIAWWVGVRTGTAHDSGVRTFGSPGYGVFGTGDGRWIAIGVLTEQRLWDAVCRALELEQLEGMQFEERLARTDEVNSVIADAMSRLEMSAALDALEGCGAPASPVLRPEELTRHPHFVARGIHVRTEGGTVAALPAHLLDGAVRAASIPELNEHPEGFSDRPAPAPGSSRT